MYTKDRNSWGIYEEDDDFKGWVSYRSGSFNTETEAKEAAELEQKEIDLINDALDEYMKPILNRLFNPPNYLFTLGQGI